MTIDLSSHGYEGTIDPPGATWHDDEQAWNFVLYAESANRVELWLFTKDNQDTPQYRLCFHPFQHRVGPIWSIRVGEEFCPDATYYAYRVWHQDPHINVLTQNGNKTLLDPYARAIFFPPNFSREKAKGPHNNSGQAPLGQLLKPLALERRIPYPLRRDSDLLIYELHVGGFTKMAMDMSPELRGTYLGVIEKIPYLLDLGVTAVELMPVMEVDPHENNYWGYMTLNYFAPSQRFATKRDGVAAIQEFRQMVDALHKAGIEVILDVVYNHTCEAGLDGPTYSFKGIDPSMYYMLNDNEDEQAELVPFRDFTGCGNTLNPNAIAVQHLVLESLRWWHHRLCVDGFRFDLAAAFARKSDGTVDTGSPTLFGQIGVGLGSVPPRLIGEPWDAAGAYQLGHAFPGTLWRQWNGRFRDCAHAWLAGHEGLVGELMTRMYGSADLFPDDLPASHRPWQSVNYVCSHDGASLIDLVSYEEKNNWANGEQNNDGPDEVRWNCGHEGRRNTPPQVEALRLQQTRNAMCLVLLANGTSMIRMGDEFLHSQQGNTNPWNQDNEITWLSWSKLEEHGDMYDFVRLLIYWRRCELAVSRSTFWRDVTWYGAKGPIEIEPPHKVVIFKVRGRHLSRRDCIVMINGDTINQTMKVPLAKEHLHEWKVMLNTAATADPHIYAPSDAPQLNAPTGTLVVAAHSIVVLVSVTGSTNI